MSLFIHNKQIDARYHKCNGQPVPAAIAPELKQEGVELQRREGSQHPPGVFKQAAGKRIARGKGQNLSKQIGQPQRKRRIAQHVDACFSQNGIQDMDIGRHFRQVNVVAVAQQEIRAAGRLIAGDRHQQHPRYIEYDKQNGAGKGGYPAGLLCIHGG